MRVQFAVAALLIFGIAAGTAPAEAEVQGCTIEQRIELAKAGYDKAEVETLCAQSAARTSGPAPRGSLEVLQAATYDVPTEKRLTKIYGLESKCEFLEHSVRMHRNGLKELSYSELFSGKAMRGDVFNANRSKGVISAHILVTKPKITGYDTCYAFHVLRTGISADEFDTLAAELKLEFDAVKAALAERGVRFR